MNTQQARERVAETFPQPFSKGKFLEFSRNLLNKFDETKAAQWNATYVKDAFKPHVSRFERLGTYTSPDDETLDVLIVHLTNESKLERARTAIRNFVADHLKQRDGKEAALVAFVSPTERQWRFSYVKMEYAAVETESGKIGVETRLTPARRYSYIVGEGESCHTAQTRFLALLQDTENYPSLAQLEEAFSVEAVTKEFFNQYAALFGDIEAALRKLAAKDPVIGREFKAKNVSTVDFAKKLMGQVVFLYFLQKKGWLGVAKGQDWGTGPHDFLRRIVGQASSQSPGVNIFNDILEPLFYDTLATDRGHEAWCKHFKCRIPFLNGGLFEPLADYDWRKTDIILPNNLFTNTERNDAGDTGTGVLDVFDRYNFTVNEAEPLEKEVAIDPEMLGKVFENLIEENRRKGLGSFYTPREIVHYKCQQCLINYLDTALNKDKEVVPRADIETFIYLGEQISHYEAVDAKYAIKMPATIEKNARLIDEKLASITVCDPAVGSGAYPVGMMTEIVRARCALTPYFNDVHERTPYHFKRHAIQNCLYGVDIDPGAVEIAKLRLWLSLVVDEEDVKQVKPLPNLDFKIVTGDSLVGFPFKSQRLHEIEELKTRFFEETDHNRKAQLKQQIDHKLAACFAASKNSLGYEVNFDFEVYFSEVFHRKGGFDVVIANPPYITFRGKERVDVSDEHVKLLLRLYPNSAEYKVNSYALFIERSLRLLSRGGDLAFIVPSTILQNEYLQKIRRHLLSRFHVARIVSFGNRVFEAVTDSIILFVRNVVPANATSIAIRQEDFVFDAPAERTQFSQSAWLHTNGCVMNLRVRPEQSGLLTKIESGCVVLDEILEVYVGIVASGIKKFLHNKRANARCKKYLQGRHMRRYVNAPEELFIDFDVSHLHSNTDERVYLQPEKLLVRKTGNVLLASYDSEQFYTDQSIYNLYRKRSCTLDLKFVLALLNSRLLNYYFRTKMITNADVFPYIKGIHLKLLPIHAASPGKQRPIEQLVDRILVVKQRDADADTSALEREIDELVYALYGLSPEEKALVQAAPK